MNLILDPMWLLLCALVAVHAIGRWQYWRGRCEAIENDATQTVQCLRKRVKANSRLLASYEKRFDAELDWLMDVVDEVVDAALPDAPQTEPETPADGG